MIAPDGKRYSNRMQFRRIERPHLIEIDHGADKDNDPGIFRTTITFDEQSDGKTVITARQLHPTKAQRDATRRSASAQSNSVIRPSTSWRNTSKAARLRSKTEQRCPLPVGRTTADICSATGHVRFAPNSGHVRCKNKCPLRARSRHIVARAAGWLTQ
ncbi:MAG: SRPBCC domain-containing protein [Pseudolabrys sp.]